MPIPVAGEAGGVATPAASPLICPPVVIRLRNVILKIDVPAIFFFFSVARSAKVLDS